MAHNDLNELLAPLTEEDVDTLFKSAYSSMRYRLERLLTIVSAFFLSVSIPLTALAVIHAYAPNLVVRVVITVLVLSAMYVSLKLALPMNRCQVPCDHISQRVWRLSAARDAMKQLYQHLGT